MHLETFQYTARNGWSTPLTSDLDSPDTLVLAFGSSGYKGAPGPLEEVDRAWPRAHMMGCSTAGEIFGAQVEDDSLSIAVARFDGTEVATAFAPLDASQDLLEAGRSIARQLYKPSLRGVLVLSDGQNVNGSELVRGLNETLPASVIVTGGLAGDGDRFGRTWVLKDRRPEHGFVSAVGFYGDRIRIGHGSQGGWDIFGPEREVTRAERNVLYELGGKPALQLYKTYLGEQAAGLPATALLFPLAVRVSMHDDKRVVRTVLSVDEERQSMTFAGDIPQGSFVQLMRANMDRLIEGASSAALRARDNAITGPDTLSIAISCVGRRLVLGERVEEELEATLDALPVGARQVGFYSYGEISPFGTGCCDLHNQTMTLTTLFEE